MRDAAESAPTVVKTGGYYGADYPRSDEAAAKKRSLRWLIIGGMLFVLADAVVLGYVVLNADTLFSPGDNSSNRARPVSAVMGARPF